MRAMHNRALTAFAGFALLAVLGGCDTVRETLGATRQSRTSSRS